MSDNPKGNYRGIGSSSVKPLMGITAAVGLVGIYVAWKIYQRERGVTIYPSPNANPYNPKNTTNYPPPLNASK